MNPDQHTWPKWATEPVKVVEPETSWAEAGAREKKELAAILAPFGILEIQHIGSTSVPGLPAKPILDLVGQVSGFGRITDMAGALTPYGWHYVPPELDQHPDRRFFVKVKNDRRIAHLHILPIDSKRWTDQLLLRDELIRNPGLSARYAALKTSLSRQYELDREAYTRAKSAFIEEALSGLRPSPKPRLIFATNNQHKVEEIQSAIGSDLEVISLLKAGIDIDIPEPFDTLEANASEKSTTIHRLTGENCFSEDTGLEVAALNGEPGVKSARYAGEDRAFEKNVEKLLYKLEGSPDRTARFRTVISLLLDGHEHLFEGICEGKILTAPSGNKGFGYDPVFAPDGEERSFAEMTLEEKNRYSHRRKAADKLVEFLRKK